MKTYHLLINAKDFIGTYAILCITLEDDQPKPNIDTLRKAWVKQTMEDFLSANPELWDDECKQLVRSGQCSRDELLIDVVGDSDGYPYGGYQERADGFIEHLIELHGFERAPNVLVADFTSGW